MVYSDFCLGEVGERSPLVELLVVYGGDYISSTVGISYCNRDGKLEGYPLGEWKFCSEEISEVGSYVGILDGSR